MRSLSQKLFRKQSSASENTEIPDNRLVNELSDIIEKKRLELLRLNNSRVITLFWEIGKELNESLDKNKGAGYSKSAVIRTVSNQLVTNYGAYFSEKNLNKMGQFAKKFPDHMDVLQQVASYVSWEHIVFLLQAKDVESWVFLCEVNCSTGPDYCRFEKANCRKCFRKNKRGKGT